MGALVLSVALLVATAWGVGAWLTPAPRDTDDVETGFAWTVLCGLLVMAGVLPCLFLLGVPRGGLLVCTYAAAACGVVRHVRRGPRFSGRACLAGLGFAVLLGVPMLLALDAPPLRYDALAIWWPKVQEVAAGQVPIVEMRAGGALQMHAEYPRGLAWLASVAAPGGAPDPRWVKASGLLFTWLVALLMAAWGRATGRAATGVLAGALLLALPDVAMWSHAGYADTALAAAVLVAGLGLGARTSTGVLAAAVAGAGATAVKQEGTLVLLAVLGVMARDLLRGGGSVRRAWIVAAAVLVGVPWWWKRTQAPAEVLSATTQMLASPDLLLSRADALARAIGRLLVDPASVWSGAGPHVTSSFAAWGIVVCGVVLLPRGRRPITVLPAVVLVAGVLAVYLVTSKDLGWHVHTALPRLVLQPLPLLLLAAAARLTPQRT